MKKNNKTIKKADLPTKICLACARPFAWRKKWERDWESVKFCSDKCRGEAKKTTSTTVQPTDTGGGRKI